LRPTPSFRVESYCGKGSGTAWFADLSMRRETPPPVQTFLLYPNYRGLMFSDESQVAELDVMVNLPNEIKLSQLHVEADVLDSKDAVVKRLQFEASPEFVAMVDMRSLPAGSYQVEASLLGLGGERLFTQSAYKVVKVRADVRPKMKVWVDRSNYAHFGDGRRKFVLGIYDTTGYSPSEASYEPRLQNIAQAPLNMIINYLITNATVSEIDAYVSAMQRHGIFFLATANNFYSDLGWYPRRLASSLGASNQDELIGRYSAGLSGNPGVVGYYVQDEASIDKEAPTFHQYQVIRQSDPASVTLAVLFRPQDLVFWRDSVDVLATDPYPLQKPSGNNLAGVGDYTRATMAAVKGARPVWTVIQFFQANSHSSWPTKQELHDMSWMAIAEGATGLFYWSYGQKGISWVRDSARRTALWHELLEVTAEIKQLEPVLLEPDTPVLRTKPTSPSIVSKEKIASDGTRYVICYNHEAYPLDVQFRLKAHATSVNAHDENRAPRLASDGSSFSDHFNPFQAHIYEIR